MKETDCGDLVIEKGDVAIVLSSDNREPILTVPRYEDDEEVPEYVRAFMAIYIRMQRDYEWYRELIDWCEEHKVS